MRSLQVIEIFSDELEEAPVRGPPLHGGGQEDGLGPGVLPGGEEEVERLLLGGPAPGEVQEESEPLSVLVRVEQHSELIQPHHSPLSLHLTHSVSTKSTQMKNPTRDIQSDI